MSQKCQRNMHAVNAPGGRRGDVTSAEMSSHLSTSVAPNLNIYSSCSVMNSILTNKGSDGTFLETIIPIMVVRYWENTYF